MARKDFTQVAHRVFKESIGEPPKPPRERKKTAAQEQGKVGGQTRAAKLTPEERSAIAKKAAAARWANKDKSA